VLGAGQRRPVFRRSSGDHCAGARQGRVAGPPPRLGPTSDDRLVWTGANIHPDPSPAPLHFVRSRNGTTSRRSSGAQNGDAAPHAESRHLNSSPACSVASAPLTPSQSTRSTDRRLHQGDQCPQDMRPRAGVGFLIVAALPRPRRSPVRSVSADVPDSPIISGIVHKRAQPPLPDRVFPSFHYRRRTSLRLTVQSPWSGRSLPLARTSTRVSSVRSSGFLVARRTFRRCWTASSLALSRASAILATSLSSTQTKPGPPDVGTVLRGLPSAVANI